ncbi:MAG: hypothetical protein ABJD13_16060 [Paracoccaceae bacterium]
MRVRKFVKLVPLCAGLALAACSPNLEFSVKKRWEKGIRNLAVLPVYPMREDVFVGTVRLLLDEENPFELLSRNYGFVDLSQELNASSRAQPNLPKTDNPSKITLADGTTKTVSKWEQPTDSNGVFRTGTGTPDRLRLAALPGVSVVRISSADVARRNLLSVISGAFRREANLNIDLSGVETMEIDDVTAFRVFNNDIIRRFKDDPWFAHSICQSAVTLKTKNPANLRLQMITRVFYARGIIYDYGNSVGSSLSAGQGIEPPTGAQADPGAAAPIPVQAPLLTDAGATPGTVARLATYGSQGSTLSEVFERPMAFGVTGIAFAPVGDTFGLSCEGGKATFNEAGRELGYLGSPDVGVMGGPVVAAPAAQPPSAATAAPLSVEGLNEPRNCQTLLDGGTPASVVDALRSAGKCK